MKERKIEVLHNQVPFGYTVNNDGTVKIYKGKREEPKDYSISEIAKMCGVNYNKAYNTARKIEDLLNPNMENNQKRYSEFDKNIISMEIDRLKLKNLKKDISKQKSYSIKEAAKILNVSESTIYLRVKTGRIKATKQPAKYSDFKWMIEQSEIERYVKENPDELKPLKIEYAAREWMNDFKTKETAPTNDVELRELSVKIKSLELNIHDLVEQVYDLTQMANVKKKRFSFFGLLK